MTDRSAVVAVAALQDQRREATRRLLVRFRRRSMVVHFWRGALPVFIAAALLILGSWAGVRTFANLSRTPQNTSAIRMVGPVFHGRSRDGRPYTVTADSAVRDALHPERSLMVEPRLVMESAAHGVVHVSAHRGLYNELTKIMDLTGAVKADTGKGEHFASPAARVDTASGRVDGNDGVSAASALGQTRGASYSIDNKSGHVVLTGGVHSHLVPHGAS